MTMARQVVCNLDEILLDRNITQAELARRAGITVVNLSVLKNNHAKAIRFTTLISICTALECQPGDLFTVSD